MTVSRFKSLGTRTDPRRLLLLSCAALALAAPFAPAAFAADTDTAAATNAAVVNTGAANADAAASTSDTADAGGDLGPEITVTARHREEKLQDVPVAISVLGTERLEQTDDYSLNQFQHEVPSLQVVNTNPRNSVITIRGLGANSSIAVDGLEYGVGFYLDGVYFGRPGQSQFDLVDLQQVEVLRGPQGTLFGKNTTAGAINITSQLPSFTPQLTAEASFGNYNSRQLRASVSAPLIADKLAFRLSASDTHHDGYLTNLFDGSKAENYDDVSVRGQLLFTPTPDLKIRLIGDFSRERQHYILTLLDGTFTKFGNGAPIPFNINQRAALFNLTLPAYGAFARLGNSNSPFQANMKSYGTSGQIDYDVGHATLTSITAYRWWDWRPANDVDGLPLSINLKGQQQNFQRQFSQELRVASSGHHFIDYVGGLYYFWQTVPGYGQSQFGSDFANWSFNPATTPPARLALYNAAFSNAEADSYSVANTKSYAAYAQIDTHLTNALTLTTGLRFTHEDKNGLYNRYQLPATAAQLAILPGPLAAVLLPGLQLSNLGFAAVTHNSALSGLVTLDYKITPDVLAYGTYSRGNQSGGLNITAGGVLNPVVAPEKVDNFELGLKSQFLNRTLTVNADAFLTNVKDYQANVTVVVNNVTTQYIANIPKVRSKGFEGDISYSPSKWISLTASGTYTDAKYVSYVNAPAAADNPQANATNTQDLSGVALPGVSKFAYSLVADLSQPVASNLEGYVHADYLHRSSFNTSTTNSVYAIVPAYGLLDGRIGIRTADRRYDLSIFARNLTNKNYYISRNATNYGLITAAVGDPRTYGVTLRAKL
jgi:iron complex outermembrane receptor protein